MAGAADDNLTAVLNVAVDRFFQRKLFRAVLVDRQHVDAERGFQRGELEELVDDHLRAGVAFQLDLDARFLIGKIAHAGYSGEGFLVHQLRDARLQYGAVHSVRHLADDDHGFSILIFLDLDLAAEAHGASAGAEIILDTAFSTDLASDREIGAFDVLHQAGEVDFRIVNHRANTVDHLAEVVRGEVCRHADGDAGAAVDKEVRKSGGHYGRLWESAVVVRDELDRVLVEIFHHRHAERVEPRLGVTHRGRGIAFHRSEVSLAIDDQLTHRPRLTHVHEGGVD